MEDNFISINTMLIVDAADLFTLQIQNLVPKGTLIIRKRPNEVYDLIMKVNNTTTSPWIVLSEGGTILTPDTEPPTPDEDGLLLENLDILYLEDGTSLRLEG